MQCGSCGAGVPDGARFCPQCGQQVVSALGTAEERRIVTMLFADLVGFTTLSEHLDPEQVKRLVDSCFERMVQVVTEFGGRVDKILGDGMLVLFGAPVAHEDDPERAVRAALRMQHVLADHVSEHGLGGETAIRMRVGVNTGEALVGTLAGTDYTAMGDAVNLASRLQAAAPPGGVLVGDVTHALTSHTFEYQPIGELQVKGREQPERTWLALEATAPAGVIRRQRKVVDFVGRAAELAIADAALAAVAQHERGLVLHVNGESGVGKSRYLDEVITRLRALGDAAVLKGTCVPYGESNVWWPLASALSQHLGLDAAESDDDVRRTAGERAEAMFPDRSEADHQQLVDVFSHLFGLPSGLDRLDAASAHSAIRQLVADVLEARARRSPVVLCIDDLHWADQVLIDLLQSLVGTMARGPVILLTSMRPGSDVQWPVQSDRCSTISLTMQPLDRDETHRLAAALLDDPDADAARLDALFDRSGGNPLFLVELAALTRSGSRAELPDSLRTLIAARLDQLELAQRQVLENAAVMGASGSMLSLEKFAQALGQPDPAGAVAELDEAGLLVLDGRQWSFRSESVRDAAYQTLTKAARAQRHAGVARSLAAGFGQADDIAHHLATAAELVQELGRVDGVPGDIVRYAITALTTAAERASEGGSLKMAVRHTTRAIDLAARAGDDSPDIARLLVIRAGAFTDQRRFDAATADIDAIQGVAERTSDTVLRSEAHRLRGMLAYVSGALDTARSELGTAVDLARGTDRTDLLADALRLRGFIEMFVGSLADARWFLGEAEGLFRSLGDERGLAYVEQHGAWISFQSGDMADARARLNSAADTLLRLGDRNGVGWALGLLAFVEFFERHFEEAENLAGLVRREAETRGDDWAGAMMDTLMAALRLWQGKLDESRTFAERSNQRFKKLGDPFGVVQSLAALVRVQVAQGRFADAQRSSEELAALAETGRNGTYPLLAAAGAAMHRGNATTAAALAERAVELMKANGAEVNEASTILALALAQQGRIDDALITIESLGGAPEHHPFTGAVAALVHSLAHRPREAIEHARRVTAMEGATYLDEVFAHIAAAAAHAALDEPEQARQSAEAAMARSLAVGDVVAIALSAGAFEAATGQPHDALDRTRLGDGWLRLLASLAGRG
ncbi:MAG: adenylate/guanylate cyclase domain-containing protein [Actinomycetota bacterium]